MADNNSMTFEDFDVNAFSDSLVQAWRYAKTYPYQCCCPDCKEKAVKSHLLQQHPILESICDEKNSVLQMVDNVIDPRSGKWDLYSKRNVGITDALQYKLFCAKHDDSLFKNIEAQNSIPRSKRDCLLLAFRSACAVRHQEEHRLHIFESERDSRGQKSPLEDNSRLFIQRMDGVVDNLWEAINDKRDDYYLFRMISMPRVSIAASDCMIEETCFEDHILNDDYRGPLNGLFINLIPFGDKLYLLLGCDTRYDNNGEYRAIIEGFSIGDFSYDYYLDTIKGILLKCSNWCCSPQLYEDVSWKAFFDEYERLKVANILSSN